MRKQPLQNWFKHTHGQGRTRTDSKNPQPRLLGLISLLHRQRRDDQKTVREGCLWGDGNVFYDGVWVT